MSWGFSRRGGLLAGVGRVGRGVVEGMRESTFSRVEGLCREGCSRETWRLRLRIFWMAPSH